MAHLHQLRHYSASVAIAAGSDVRTVAGRLGHAHTSTTLNIYAHVIDARDQQLASLLGLTVLGAASVARRDAAEGLPISRGSSPAMAWPNSCFLIWRSPYEVRRGNRMRHVLPKRVTKRDTGVAQSSGDKSGAGGVHRGVSTRHHPPLAEHHRATRGHVQIIESWCCAQPSGTARPATSSPLSVKLPTLRTTPRRHVRLGAHQSGRPPVGREASSVVFAWHIT